MSSKDFEPIKDVRLYNLIDKYSEATQENVLAKAKLEFLKSQIIALAKENSWRRVECGKAKVYEVKGKSSTYYRIDLNEGTENE